MTEPTETNVRCPYCGRRAMFDPAANRFTCHPCSAVFEFAPLVRAGEPAELIAAAQRRPEQAAEPMSLDALRAACHDGAAQGDGARRRVVFDAEGGFRGEATALTNLDRGKRRRLAMTDDARQRIDQLERDKRWWKQLAIGLAVVLVFVLAAGVVRSTVMRAHAREAEREALKAQERAREAQRQAAP